VIVWLNGTFGVGKTTTARALLPLLPGSRIFDSEYVGFMLRHVLTEPVRDFQDWPPWRSLVVRTAVDVLDFVGGTLVVPQSVLVEAYAREIFAGLAGHGVPVRHVVLHAEDDELVRRIDGDTVEAGAREWRIDHLADYRAAVPWLHAAADVVDTGGRTPEQVARTVADLA
jgi:hypothetical protein